MVTHSCPWPGSECWRGLWGRGGDRAGLAHSTGLLGWGRAGKENASSSKLKYSIKILWFWEAPASRSHLHLAARWLFLWCLAGQCPCAGLQRDRVSQCPPPMQPRHWCCLGARYLRDLLRVFEKGLISAWHPWQEAESWFASFLCVPFSGSRPAARSSAQPQGSFLPEKLLQVLC